MGNREKNKALWKGGEKSYSILKELVTKAVEENNAPEAVKDYLDLPYKPMRAGFTVLSCEAVGGSRDSVTEIALVMELFRAAISIHDDIIDRSLMKRLEKTIFAKHDRAASLILGDWYFCFFSTQLGRIIIGNSTIPHQRKRALLETIERAVNRLARGALMELSMKNTLDYPEEEYLCMVELKVSDLEACMRVGAVAGGGDEQQIETLSQYGSHLGVLMQLRDDLMDSMNIGDALANRLRNESLPLSFLYASKESDEVKEMLLELFHDREKPVIPSHLFKAVKSAGGIDHLEDIRIQKAQDIMKLLERSELRMQEELKLILSDALFRFCQKWNRRFCQKWNRRRHFYS